MAKASKIVKNEKRRKLVERYAERRAELKEIIRNPASSRDARARQLAHRGELPGVRKSSW